MWRFFKKHKIIIVGIWGFSTTCLSIYLAFYPPTNDPKVTFYQKEKFDVFAYDNSIDELKILLNGKEISSQQDKLEVYKIKLINNGDRDIRSIDFSEDLPFGIKVTNGTIVRTIVTDSSPKQLIGLIEPMEANSSFLQLKKKFLGKNDFISFDLWLIHPNGIEPHIEPVGKVADTVISYEKSAEESDSSFWEVLTTFFILGLLIFAFILFAVLIVSLVRMLLEGFNVIQFSIRYNLVYQRGNRYHRVLRKIYREYGESQFFEITSVLLDNQKVFEQQQVDVENEKIVQRTMELHSNGNIDNSGNKVTLQYTSWLTSIRRTLLKAKVINEKGNEIYIDKSFQEQIRLFIKDEPTVLFKKDSVAVDILTDPEKVWDKK